MDTKKPILRILFISIALCLAHFIVIVILTVFSTPLLYFMGATDAVLAAGQPVPLIVLVGNFIGLLAVIILSYRIQNGLNKEPLPKISCICAFVYAGLTPVLFPMLDFLLNLPLNLSGTVDDQMKYQGLLMLTSLFDLIEPLRFASIVLLAIGAALALYRQTFFNVTKNSDNVF